MLPENRINMVVYFTASEKNGYPFTDPGYYSAYLDFFEYGSGVSPNIYFFVVRGNSYLGNDLFASGEYYNPRKKILEDYPQQIKADIIYNKGDLSIASNEVGTVNIVNHPVFNQLCKDKVQSAFAFPEHFPMTIEVRSPQELLQAARRFDSEKVVIKPRFGEGGRGVKVIEKKRIQELKLQNSESMLIQEFLDTSCGLFDIIKSSHDFRVTIMNGEIIEANIRAPAPGKYVSNLSQGGRLNEIGIEEIPSEFLKIVRNIDMAFKIYFPRIYSVDFGCTPDGPRIFELNSQPGLPSPDCTMYYRSWHKNLLDTLLSSLSGMRTFSKKQPYFQRELVAR